MQFPDTEQENADGALARRIQQAAPGRDREAEALLYRNLAPRARLYGLRHLRDPEAAADLAQEVLLLAIRRLREGGMREPERIASFVLGACRQTIVDWRRKDRRRERNLLAYASELSDVTSLDAEPLNLDQLSRCMEGLPERDRAVLLMTFYDERPADQIATEMGTSAENVRVIRHRGIQRLRRCMEQRATP